jgi:vitamin B12 transporter
MILKPFSAGVAALSLTVPVAAAAVSLETIVVTASRTSMPLADVGGSVTIIDGVELERRQTSALSEVLRDVPGFAVSRSGVLGSSTQVRVRGAEGNHVMVMIDGVEANDLAQGDEFNFGHLLAADVERIEILRGPQSALWGSDALAGVINVITRRGVGPARVRAHLEGGSFGTVNAGASVSGGGERHHFSVGGAVLFAAGSNISRAGDEDDGYDNTSLSFAGGLALSPWLDLDATARHVDARNEYDETDFLTGLPADSDYHSDAVQDYARVRLRLSPPGGHWSHEASAAVARTDNENFRGEVDDGSNTGRRWTFGWQTDYRVRSGGPVAAEHVLTAALEHEYEEFIQRGPVVPFVGDPNQDRDARTTSVVGEYRIAAERGWTVSAGVRHDANNTFRNDTTWRVTGTLPVAATGTRLRASYGTGSKNPTFTERFGFFSVSVPAFVGNPDLEPERSRGWEAGLTQWWLEGRISADVVYFRERLRREINGFVFDPATFTITADNVQGTSRRDGVEATASVQVAPGWTVRGHYTWLDATQPDGFGRDARELRRPRHSGGLNLNAEFADGRGNVNVNYLHTGAQRDLFFPPTPPFVEEVTLAEFDLVAVAASWRLLPQATLFARVENALDEDYEEVFGFRTPGIGAFAGIRVNFDGPMFWR